MKKMLAMILFVIFAIPAFAQGGLGKVVAEGWLSKVAKAAAAGERSTIQNMTRQIVQQTPSLEVLKAFTPAETAATFDGIGQSEFMNGPLSHNVPEAVKQMEQDLYKDILWHRAYWVDAFKKNPQRFFKEIRFDTYNIEDIVFISGKAEGSGLLPKESKVFFLQGSGSLWKTNEVAQTMLAQYQAKNHANGNMVLAPKAPELFKYVNKPAKGMNLVKDVHRGRWKDKPILNMESGVGAGAEAAFGMRLAVQRIPLKDHQAAARELTGASRTKRAFAFSHVGSVDISKEAKAFVEGFVTQRAKNFPEAAYFVIDYKRPHWNTSILPVSLDHPGSVARMLDPEFKPFVVKFSDVEGDLVSYIRQVGNIDLGEGKIVVVRAKGQAANLLGANLYIWVR